MLKQEVTCNSLRVKLITNMNQTQAQLLTHTTCLHHYQASVHKTQSNQSLHNGGHSGEVYRSCHLWSHRPNKLGFRTEVFRMASATTP